MKSVRSFLFGIAIIVSLVSSLSQAQYMSSAYNCAAATPCVNANGQVTGHVQCQVFGHQYVSGYGVSSQSSCTWRVVPYQSVQCSGFAYVQDVYGRNVWAWQNYSFSCPGY